VLESVENVFMARDNAGWPFLAATVNGVDIRIHWEQKMLDQYGIVFLSAELGRRVPPIELPADPENGRPDPEWIDGCSDDPRIIEAVREFKRHLDEGTGEYRIID
jgi:hypothetical protein